MADIETLLHELGLLGDPIPRSRVVALLRSFTGQRLYFAHNRLVRPEQVRLAQKLLGAGMARPDVVRALTERLQVSQATANRIVNRALQERAPAMSQLELLS